MTVSYTHLDVYKRQLYTRPIYIDSVYKCYFTQKGALDNMELSEQAPSEQFNFMDESEVKGKK